MTDLLQRIQDLMGILRAAGVLLTDVDVITVCVGDVLIARADGRRRSRHRALCCMRMASNKQSPRLYSTFTLHLALASWERH